MRLTDELCQKLFEEIFRDKLRRALEDDAPAIQELRILAQQINNALRKKTYYDGNKAHAVGTIYLRDGITKIADWSFEYCNQLEKIHIPDSVTKIGWCAFFCCGRLSEINIPENLIKIGARAFYGCGNLKKISYYRKTEPLLRDYFGEHWHSLQKTVLD